MKVFKILTKLGLFILAFFVLYAPRPGALPAFTKHIVFAQECSGQCSKLWDNGDGTYTVFHVECGGSCYATVIGTITACMDKDCSGYDPSLANNTPCYPQASAPDCFTCEGGCSEWRGCGYDDCTNNVSGCSWSAWDVNDNGQPVPTACSGQTCTYYCNWINVSSGLCSGPCSVVNHTGQCAGVWDPYSPNNGLCKSACNQCIVSAPLVASKTCKIDSVSASTITQGQPLTVNFSGNNENSGSSDTVRLWVEQWPNGTAINPPPSTSPYVANQTYYQLASCTSTGSTACSGSSTITNLPQGTYYVHCDLPTDPLKCSGNPYCSQEGLGGTEACTGWASCSTSDNKLITVNAPPVTVKSRAVVVGASATCDEVRASTNGIDGAVHGFTVAPTPTPAPQTQSGANYVTFTGYTGTYTISPTVPSDYVVRRACWQSTGPTGSGEGFSVNAATPDETVTWDIGYSAGSAWAQTESGNVYVSGTLKSLVPSNTSPRYFNLDAPNAQ